MRGRGGAADGEGRRLAAPRDGSHGAVRRRAAVVLAVLAAALLAAPVALVTDVLAQETTGRSVAVTEVTGVVTPITADHLDDVVERADAAGNVALVVRLDTPGGLVDSTRRIVQTFLDAPIPVIVHVAPSGADAGSAGTFITYAAHVAAMAPATTIGAATPVGGEGEDLDAKITENTAAFAEAIAQARDRDVDFAVEAVREGRSVTAQAALEAGAIDTIAASLDELLTEIDGTEVEVRDGVVVLATADAAVEELPVGTARRILGFLSDPNLAFVFLSLGTIAIVYEIANPGLGLGGVIGATSIILAMVGLAVLPVNVAGIALLLVAAGMFVAELFTPGIGAGAGGGSAALILASIFLFPSDTGLGVDLVVVIPSVLVVAVLSVLAGRLVARTQGRRPATYDDQLVGRTATVTGAATGTPRARFDGVSWRLRPADEGVTLRDGDEVVVVDRDGIDLLARPVRDRPPSAPAGAPPTDPPPTEES